jgi:hypothetical protein
MISIVYFTKYTEKGPSSRYRSFQYKSYLESHFNLEYYALFNDDYIENLYTHKKTNYVQIFVAYYKRILRVLKLLGTDKIVFIEYELFPFFPPIFEYLLYKTKVRFVLDYDDAIFHNYDLHPNFIVRALFKNKIPTIARKARFIITGSPYLTNFFFNFSTHVTEIPTSILYQKYAEYNGNEGKNQSIAVGWIGSRSTSKNFVFIEGIVDAITSKYPNIEFKLMGFDIHLRNGLQSKNIKFFGWSETDELPFLDSIDIGIMPLIESSGNKGKCGFKLIQYMAMGKPTISSPFEAHFKINRDGHNMFANSMNEWFDSIEYFINNMDYFRHVGTYNKEIIKKYYSVESNKSQYLDLFNKISKLCVE